MLIYSANREFLGIDEKDLKTLGFKNFLELRSEVSDFADLFVKTPGFIHNFKHVHWIDFIVYSESNEESQAVINVNNKNFKCKISIDILFLTQSPATPSYIITLNNLRELTKKESENISADIAVRPMLQSAPRVSVEEPEDDFDFYVAPKKETMIPASTKLDPYEAPLDVDYDFEDTYEEIVPQTSKDMLDVGDLSMDEEVKVEKIEKVQSVKKVETKREVFDNGYVYNPEVASHELGLPLDLIEEFIQDFIAQAKEFEVSIYEALDASEFEQVKTLSHKLKGVAANLRIEDAFEALTFVNTSNDINIIKQNLDTFYKIIAKLSGEEVPAQSIVEATIQESISQKETPLEFKEEKIIFDEDEDDLYENLLSIEDSQVPQKIELAELADDEFTSSDVDFTKLDQELENIEDIEFLELDSKKDEDFLSALEEEIPKIHYSKANVASDIGLDLESFEELFEDYLSESSDILMQMRRYAQSGDLNACAHEAMKLQGMSDNMRIKGLDEELEKIASTTKKDEVLGSIKKVELMITQISRTGV